MKKAISTFLVLLLTSSMLAVFASNVEAQGAAEQLTTNPYKDRYPSWSPDGAKIIYSAFSGSWNRHLWVMNSDGSGKVQLTFGDVVDECPVFSPDGSKILFTRWGFRGDYLDLMLMDADLSSPPERLTSAGIPGLAEGTYNFPKWSQDGSKIVFAYGEGTTGVSWENKKFWVCIMNPDGTGIEVLGRGVYPKFVLGDSKILFNTDRYGGADLRIAIMNADGTGFEYLTDGPADHSADMSPLTDRIAFTRAPAFGQNGDLYIRRLSSSDVTPLIEDGQNQQAFWSPDGESIVYVSEATGNLDIWKVGAPPEEGPAGYWKFDEGSGTVASDSSGNGNTGSLMNGPQWVDGIKGKALVFDGVDDYVYVPHSASLDIAGNEISVEFWMKLTNGWDPDPGASYTQDQILFDKGDAYTSAMIKSTGALRFNIPYVPPYPETNKNSWDADTWYHIAEVFDGNQIKIYINGVLDKAETVIGSVSRSTINLAIGAHCFGGSNFFNGTIDEFAIYNYARTAGEIWSDYSSSVVSLPWKDDFDYATKGDMEAAGWRLEGVDSFISVSGGVLTLENDGSAGCHVKFLNHFPSGTNDFRVEARGRWVGQSYGQRTLFVWTQRHLYCWYGDGYYPEYSFIRYSDGWGGTDEKVLRFAGYTPVLNEWSTFALEKRGNTFYMYQDGELKNVYTEADAAPDELVGVSINAGWMSTVEYDYISVMHTPESVTGIETVVDLSSYKTVFSRAFSIQQNLWIYGGSQEYWAQNVIQVWPFKIPMMTGLFEIYNKTLPSANTRLLAHWQSWGFGVFKETVAMRSVIEGDYLKMSNDFSSVEWQIPAAALSNVHIESPPTPMFSSPEIVIVGASSLVIPQIGLELIGNVAFEDPTSGSVDTYVKIGSGQGTWLHGINKVIGYQQQSTAEYSQRLQWYVDGQFEHAGWAGDQGLWFGPDETRPASPPVVPMPSNPPRQSNPIAMYLDPDVLPADLSIFDEQGNHIGYNSTSGLIDEIQNSWYLNSSDAQAATILDPQGTYTVLITGKARGNYTLGIARETDEGTATQAIHGTINAGQTQAFAVQVSDTGASLYLCATINVDPNTLNLRSMGNFVTTYIELPEGFDVTNINASSILLNNTVPIDLSAPITIGDYNNDGIPDLMVKFDRATVLQYLTSEGIMFANFTMTLTGRLYDGTAFEGSDTIRVIYRGGGGPGKMALLV
jgi:Tol biopolymer transport system component